MIIIFFTIMYSPDPGESCDAVRTPASSQDVWISVSFLASDDFKFVPQFPVSRPSSYNRGMVNETS